MAGDVRAWLESLELGKYTEIFAENDIDFRALPHLDRDDLKELGVSLGHRKVILAAIKALDDTQETEEAALPRSSPPAGSATAVTGEAERRQLTVMFCDLVGSTALSTKLDPEDLREVLRAYQDACAKVIAQYDGYIAKYMGDGVLVYFGYPQAHGNDAERAARAGLDLVAAVTGLGPGKAPAGNLDLAVRVGIDTGLVVVGDIVGEDAAEEASVVGKTPNVAARLQALAQPGEVLIGTMTRNLIGEAFTFDDLGEHQLKGIAEPVHAWRVLGEGRDEIWRVGRGLPLVGRREELGLLVRSWEASKEGHGQAVLIQGEAGIGKSRLVEALREQVAGEDYVWVTVRCSPYHANSTLYPVIEHLKRVMGWKPEDSAEERFEKLEVALGSQSLPLKEAVPLYAELMAVPVPESRYQALTLNADQKREQTLDALAGWLLEEAEQRPVLQVWEDLHWADPTTLELLGLYVEQSPTVSMLDVLTYRPEFVPPWTMRSHMTPITLNRLERPEAEALIEHQAGGKEVPPEVVRHIVDKADGVPLYVEELTKTILDTNYLNEEADRYTLNRPLSEVAIPTSLQDSLMARLDRLPTLREVAQIGAVLGREFAYELLRVVAGLEEPQLQSGLEQLVADELLYQRGRFPRSRYIFKHALIQDAAYESLLLARRRTIHASILAALEAAHRTNLGEVVELLAHHSQRCGLWDKAVTYLCQAGAKAYAHSASRESQAYYEQALSILEALPENDSILEQAFDIRLELRPVLNQLGEPRRMLERLREAESIAARLNDDRRRGLVCALITIAHSQLGELDEALKFGTLGLEIAGNLGDLKLRILATSYLELVHYYRGEYDMVIQLATENLDALPANWIYEFLGASAPASVYDRSWLIQSLAQVGKFADALAHEADVLRIAEPTDHPFTIGQAHRAAVTLHVLKGDWTRAHSLNEHWILVARTGNVFIQLPWAISSSAWVLAQLGEASAALERLREGEILLERQASRELVVTSGWDYHALGRAHLLLGRLDDAQRLCELAMKYSSHQHAYEAHGLHLLGDIATHPDRFDADFAEAHYLKALAIAEKQGMRPLVAHCRLGLWKVYRRMGKNEEADDLYATASAMYHEMDMRFWEKRAKVEIAMPA